MEEESTWGDHITLQAMANILKCSIDVLMSSSGEFISILPSSEPAVQRQTLVLGYIANLHYVALIPKGLMHSSISVQLSSQTFNTFIVAVCITLPKSLIPFSLPM